jgi:hypothetical protein
MDQKDYIVNNAKDVDVVVVEKKKKVNRKLLHRRIPPYIQALLNPVIIECILVHLRKLPNVGSHDLLNLRLVHKTWDYTVLTLPPSVWVHWFNPKIYWNRSFLFNERKDKGRVSIYPKIRALRAMQDDPFGLELLLNADGSNRIPSEIIHDRKLPTYHKRKEKNSGKSDMRW